MCVGLVRTVYIHRIWPYIYWFPCQEYRIYTVYIWFWPTLDVWGANPKAVLFYLNTNDERTWTMNDKKRPEKAVTQILSFLHCMLAQHHQYMNICQHTTTPTQTAISFISFTLSFCLLHRIPHTPASARHRNKRNSCTIPASPSSSVLFLRCNKNLGAYSVSKPTAYGVSLQRQQAYSVSVSLQLQQDVCILYKVQNTHQLRNVGLALFCRLPLLQDEPKALLQIDLGHPLLS